MKKPMGIAYARGAVRTGTKKLSAPRPVVKKIVPPKLKIGAPKASSLLSEDQLLDGFMRVIADPGMALKIPKGLVMANMHSKPKFEKDSSSSKEDSFKSWESDISRVFKLAFPIRVKDVPLLKMDLTFDPFTTLDNYDIYGFDKHLAIKEVAEQIVDSRGKALEEAKIMAYSIWYLWDRAQAQLYDILKNEFGKSERSLVNEYSEHALQRKLIDYGLDKDSMAFKFLPYGSLLFSAIRKTHIESTSFSVLHKLADQQTALDNWSKIDGSDAGSLSFLLDKLLEAKNATINLPFDHVQSLLMIAKLSTWTHGDWSDWAGRFYEDHTKSGKTLKVALTPEMVADAIRSHASLKNSTTTLGNGSNGSSKSANSFDRQRKSGRSCKKCGKLTSNPRHDFCKTHWKEHLDQRDSEKVVVNDNLSAPAIKKREDKDRFNKRKKMAEKNKAKRKEAFAALKILKQQKKAEANAVDRSANPICVDRDDADSDSRESGGDRKRKGCSKSDDNDVKRLRLSNLFERTDNDAIIRGFSDSDDDARL